MTALISAGSAPTVPPALAVAESLHLDGKAFIANLDKIAKGEVQVQ